MDIGEAIKTIRKKKGLKQNELAKKCGISANALCSIEQNKSFPSKETISSICSALNIPIGFLLFSCLTDDDIPQDKLTVFKAIQKPILEVFGL